MKKILLFLTMFNFLYIYNNDSHSFWGSDDEIINYGYEDINLINKVEKYLNSIKNLKSDFNQSSSNGVEARGTLYISKPGKMRLEYNLPMLIIADGEYLIYKDTDNDQVTAIPLESTPAGIMVKSYIKLKGKDITVSQTKTLSDSYEITLGLSKDIGTGSITLIFNKDKFSLKGWVLVDAQGVTTTITLFDLDRADSFNKKLFSIN